ncbi:Uncharacterised protein [Wolbachia endosymbiont wPip_Mol of Culex molestus]|nr:Uncharacterised protein [Wolbachia endosymbiont wPip_Mol of Culex molestus]
MRVSNQGKYNKFFQEIGIFSFRQGVDKKFKLQEH